MLVDDEPMVLRSIESFLAMETEYRVVSFESPVEALAAFQKQPPDVVVSDFLMPGMNGLEFLTRAKAINPETPRIILTGYADKENAIKGINDVGLYHYLEKPWDNNQLRLVLDNAVRAADLQCLLNEKVRDLDRLLRANDRLTMRDERIRRELELARQVQRQLLPPDRSDLGGLNLDVIYRPAMEIGGDFYDTVPLAGGGRAILLADIMGHGIQAALSTTLVKFALAAMGGQELGPDDLLVGMNRILRQGLPSSCFVAAMAVTVEKDNRICRVANAGLPHPYVLRRNTDRLEAVAVNGMLLGFADEDLYQTDPARTVELDRGDCLLLFTDGLTEAADADGVMFGEENLLRAIREDRVRSCRNMLEDLVDRVLTFGDEEDRDDITLLSIEAG